jgi:hypothetical protein
MVSVFFFLLLFQKQAEGKRARGRRRKKNAQRRCRPNVRPTLGLAPLSKGAKMEAPTHFVPHARMLNQVQMPQGFRAGQTELESIVCTLKSTPFPTAISNQPFRALFTSRSPPSEPRMISSLFSVRTITRPSEVETASLSVPVMAMSSRSFTPSKEKNTSFACSP